MDQEVIGMSFQSRMFCLMAGKSDAKRDQGLKTPKNIRRIDNIPYGPDVRWNTLDVYRPRNKSGELPVIVNVHGGGYVYGSTKQYQFYCMNLAEKGFAVVSFNYHLAPKYKFPTPVLDLNLVLNWVCRKADVYGFDTEQEVLIGESAGAQNASQYAVIWSSPEYASIMKVTPPRFRLAAVGLNCGMYDLRRRAAEKSSAGLDMTDYFTVHPYTFGKMLDVLDYINPNFPPTYLLSFKGDFLVEECRPMAERIGEQGVPCAFKIYGNENNGHVFHLHIREKLAQEANADEIAFIRQYL